MLCIIGLVMKERNLTMKIDQVDCTVLGTVGSCILKVLPLTLKRLSLQL